MPLDQGDGDRETARKRGRRGARALKLTLVGGAVALLVRADLRNRLLNLLLGAEEEFDYSTLTESPAPSEPPEVRSEPFVRSAAHESADEEPEREDAPEIAEPDEQPGWEFTPRPATVENEPDGAHEEAPQAAEPDEQPGWEFTPRPATVENEPDGAHEEAPQAAEPDEQPGWEYTPRRVPVEEEPDWAQAQTARFEEEPEPEAEDDAQVGEPDEEEQESSPAESPLGEPSPPADETSRGPTSIAPSPADWRAAAAEREQDVDDEPQRNAAGTEDSSVEPPAPPVGWWQPTRPGLEPR